MPVKELIIENEVGLHARPASKFIQVAAAYPCDINICNLTTASKTVNAKSILSVLTLGIDKGHTIRLETNGDQAQEALNALEELVLHNFGG